MIACISPSSSYTKETVVTLTDAQCACKINRDAEIPRPRQRVTSLVHGGLLSFLHWFEFDTVSWVTKDAWANPDPNTWKLSSGSTDLLITLHSTAATTSITGKPLNIREFDSCQSNTTDFKYEKKSCDKKLYSVLLAPELHVHGVGNAAQVQVLQRVVEDVREFHSADYPPRTVTVLLMLLPLPSCK